jgi:hypothetical protein
LETSSPKPDEDIGLHLSVKTIGKNKQAAVAWARLGAAAIVLVNGGMVSNLPAQAPRPELAAARRLFDSWKAPVPPRQLVGNIYYVGPVTMKVNDAGKMRPVIFFSSVSIVGGTRLLHEPAYPTIADDYRTTLARLKALPCEIWFAPHGGQFAMAEKFERLDRGETQPNPLIDPAGWQALLATAEKTFLDQLAAEIPGGR